MEALVTITLAVEAELLDTAEVAGLEVLFPQPTVRLAAAAQVAAEAAEEVAATMLHLDWQETLAAAVVELEFLDLAPAALVVLVQHGIRKLVVGLVGLVGEEGVLRLRTPQPVGHMAEELVGLAKMRMET